MLENKTALIILALYLFISTAFYLFQPQTIHTGSMQLFFQNPNIAKRMHNAIALDLNNNTVLFTHIFHNKVLESFRIFGTNLYRSVDIPFLFSLTDMSTMYDNEGAIPMMFPLELPFFLLACWHLIRHWHDYRKEYWFLLPLLYAALFICGLFSPGVQMLKLLPLVLTIRLITFIGVYEFIAHSRWVKKLHLSL